VRSSRSHARQSARLALDVRHAAGALSLGWSCLGAALSERPCPL
jgi:hypothetical protein